MTPPPTAVFPDSLLAFAEDVRDRTALEWLGAHTSFMRPLHRYRGHMRLEADALVFRGDDRRGGADLELRIPLERLDDVRLGFDDCFRRSEDRQLGLAGFVPLRLGWRDPRDRRRTAYVWASFHHRFLLRASRNAELAESLGRRRRPS